MITVDLGCLVVQALWGAGLVTLEAVGKTATAGPAWNVGNRDTEPAFPAWVQRTGRALANHKENFPLFLAAVVVAHLAGAADRTTAIASVVYVVARALHGILYVAGITGLRTIAYLTGVAAALVILSRPFV